MSAEHPEQIGAYEVLGSLGKGSMGEVFKAVQPSLNRIVAIKVLDPSVASDPEWVERFEREAQAVAMLNHPNVVQIVEKDRDGELLYFVMEYVPGTSLDALLRQRRLSLAEALAMVRGVARGLVAAHRQNIIHRDLNPHNVLVSDDLSMVKIADFGISRVESLSREMGTLSTSEISMGTLHYMAPEQAENMASVDHRADIYSLGVLLYEMLTGRVPVGRFSLPSQLNPEVPSSIDPIVLKCLSAKPADRYPSVAKLLEDLAKVEDRLRLGLVDELRGISRSTQKILRPTTSLLRSDGGSRRALMIGLALLAAAVVVAGVVLWTRSGGPSEAASASAGGPDGTAAAAAEEGALATGGSLDDALEGAAERDAESPAGSPAGGAEATGVAPREPARTTPGAAASSPRPAPEPAAPAPSPAPPARGTPAPGAAASAEAAEDLRVALDKVEAGLLGPAREDLERFLERHDDHPRAPEAYLALAAVHASEGRVEEAMATYVELRSRHGRSSLAPEAAFRQAKLAEASGRGRETLGEAAAIFGEVAGQYPDSPWAPRALMERARLEQEAKLEVADPELGRNVPAAVMSWRRLVEGYPDDAAVEAALWSLGEAYEDLKEFERAAAAYTELGERFASTRYEAWWNAAQILDRKLDDDARALAAYERVPESSRHYDAAQKRIRRLSG